MRIISQDGMIDVPYEMVALHECNGKIRMNMAGDTGKGTVLAEYSTEAKARKAMEMLRSAYFGEIYLNHRDYEVVDIELSKEIEKKIREEMSKSHFLEVKPNNTAVECKIFRFPADDKVEVENANT